MNYLILDLDETVWVATKRIDDINKAQFIKQNDPIESQGYRLHLINPQEMSQLIETAINKYHFGIIFLSTGGWHPSLLKELANRLELTEDSKLQFLQSRFYSTFTDAALWENKLSHVASLNKRQRLERIIQSDHTLQADHWVILDNSKEQLDSFYGFPDIKTVHATTNLDAPAKKSFYQETLEAIEMIWKKDQLIKLKPVVHLNPTQRLHIGLNFLYNLNHKSESSPTIPTPMKFI